MLTEREHKIQSIDSYKFIFLSIYYYYLNLLLYFDSYNKKYKMLKETEHKFSQRSKSGFILNKRPNSPFLRFQKQKKRQKLLLPALASTQKAEHK